MTQDFVMGQLRLALVAILAYAGGKGWLTPQDATLITALATSMGPVLVPWAWSIMRNVNNKMVPKEAIAISPQSVNVDAPAGAAHPTKGDYVKVDGIAKVVGALLLAILLSQTMPRGAFAAPAGSCDPKALFVGIGPQNFIDRLKACGVSDFQTALADAQSSPVDNGALACLIPATVLVQAIVDQQSGAGGLVTVFQKFRRAKQSGLIGACTAYVNSTLLLQ